MKKELAILSKAAPFRAMILAAGRGERMRPLTDALPKPLLRAGSRLLIEYHVEKLARVGFAGIIINHAHLGHMIEAALGSGERYGIPIRYSPEPVALETAGGVAQALRLLEDGIPDDRKGQPFLAVNADIYCELDFLELLPVLHRMQVEPEDDLAYLVLVDNPSHHPDGDFALDAGRVVPRSSEGGEMLTFSGIGIYRPQFFREVVPGSVAKLAPLLRKGIAAGKVGGKHYRGIWVDVGTPERLRALDLKLGAAPAQL